MIDEKRLDETLCKLVEMMEEYVCYMAEEQRFNKDIAEAVSIVLTVAYERVGKSGSKQIG